MSKFVLKRVKDGMTEFYSVSNGCHEWLRDKEIACAFVRSGDAENMRKMLFPVPKIPIEIVDLGSNEGKPARFQEGKEPETSDIKQPPRAGGSRRAK